MFTLKVEAHFKSQNCLSLYAILSILILLFLQLQIRGQTQILKSKDWYRLGKNFQEVAKYDSAIGSFQKAADSLIEAKNYELYVDCFNQIGRCLQYQKKYQESLPYLSKALKVGKNFLRNGHPQIALSYNFLGSSYRHLYQYSNSLNHYKQALEIRRNHYGDNHKLVASILGNLGNLYRDWSDHNKSLMYYKQSINTAVKNDELKLAKVYLNIGAVFLSKGDYLQAATYFKKIISLLSSENSVHNRLIQKALFNIGLIYSKQYDEQTALSYYTNALNSFKNDSGEMVLILNNMAILFIEMREFERAIDINSRAIKLQNKINSKNYLSLQRLYSNLGAAYAYKKQWDTALVAFRESLGYTKKMNNYESELLIDLYSRFVKVYIKTKKFDKALKYADMSVELGKRIFGEKSRDLVSPYLEYGNIFFEKGNYKLALQYFQKASNSLTHGTNEYDLYLPPDINSTLYPYDLFLTISAKIKAFWEISSKENDLTIKKHFLRSIISHYKIATQLAHQIRTGFKNEGSKFF